MNFGEVEEILEESKFKKAVAGALLGATLASGAMAQEARVRTRKPAGKIDPRVFEDNCDPPLELKNIEMQFPETDISGEFLIYQMTLRALKDKKEDYLKIQKQYLNKKITREEAAKKLVDNGILKFTQAKGEPYIWDVLKSYLKS